MRGVVVEDGVEKRRRSHSLLTFTLSYKVLFYSPNCGHCRILEPEYVKAAEELQKLDPPIPLARINAEKYPEITSALKVEYYPTMKVFEHERDFNYEVSLLCIYVPCPTISAS